MMPPACAPRLAHHSPSRPRRRSLVLAACGTEGISVSQDDPAHRGAVLFAERCSGCHTLTPAGTQGTANRALRVQGPNLDQRAESFDDVLFAIRNGGFSGAIMPQNIVTGARGDRRRAVRLQVRRARGRRAPRPGTDRAP